MSHLMLSGVGPTNGGGSQTLFSYALSLSPYSLHDAALGITAPSGVSQWEDQSGNARHLVQATIGSRPSYNATSANFNGQPTIGLNGTTSFLSCATLAPASGAFLIFTVYRITSYSNVAQALFGSKNGSNLCIVDHISAGGYNPFTFNLNYTILPSTVGFSDVPSTTTSYAYSIAFSGSGSGTPASYASQLLGVSKTLTNGAVSDGGAGWSSGGYLGCRPSQLYFMQGEIAFFATYAFQLTSQQQTDLYNLAKPRFGLA